MIIRRHIVVIACLLMAVLLVACGSADEANKEGTKPESATTTNDKKSESDTSAESFEEKADERIYVAPGANGTEVLRLRPQHILTF